MNAMTLNEKLEFEWKKVADPVPDGDEVLIRVKAAAVNRADLMQKDGCYASPEGWPPWCGLEVAGTVEVAPAGCGLTAGQAVCALVGGGGYSELVKVPVGMAIPVPEGMSMVEAASLPEVWCTAYLNIMGEAGGMKSGDVFYMQAGASGVGLAAIQIAKSLDATVIATAGTPEKVAFLKQLGADVAMNYKTDDVMAALRDNPPSVALDCVAGKAMGTALETMRFGGRWIMIASMAGGKTDINLETVWRKRLKIIGSTLRSRSNEEKCRILESLRRDLWPKFVSGEMKTHIHGVFPISQVEEAHGVLRRGENIGKVVLTF